MSSYDELKGISVLMDGVIKDVKDWEKAGSPDWRGGIGERKGATKTGIKESIKIIRRMLQQVSDSLS